MKKGALLFRRKLKFLKPLLLAITVILVAGLVIGLNYLNSLMPIITGYSAKYLCDAVFITHRSQEDVENLDLNFSFLRFTSNKINHDEKSVTSRFLWNSSKAVYREGLGSVLIRGADESSLKKKTFFYKNTGQTADFIPVTAKNQLSSIERNLFRQKKYGGNTFAFLVIYKGKLIEEKYRSGFDKNTLFQSWSTAKSFTNALVAILIRDGKLQLGQKTGLKELGSGKKREITINHLLQMQSGLDWNEDYGTSSDVTRMLYTTGDFAGYTASKPLIHLPGTCWNYCTGSTNILTKVIRGLFPSDSACYKYVFDSLFHPLGIHNAIFETDATGNLVGSSFLFITARDYARFGWLFLRDGVIRGKRLLPEGWVKYSTTPASGSNNAYGAHFWLNREGYYPDAPRDMFYTNGVDGQRIFIIPSEDMVVVLLGYSPKSGNPMDFNNLLMDILMTVHSE